MQHILVGLVLVAALGSVARADTYIRGTQASYKLNINKGANTSSAYIDEANDTNNKNYAQFACEDGAPTFYLNSAQKLYTQQQYDDEITPDIQVSVDGARPIKMQTLSTDIDKKPDFNSLALIDKFDAQMLRFFQTAQKTVVITLPASDKKNMTFTFYTKGFTQAFAKINLCQ